MNQYNMLLLSYIVLVRIVWLSMVQQSNTYVFKHVVVIS